MTGQVVSCDGGTTFRSQFVDNEGSYASLNGRDYGDVIGTALEPTREGYKFAGWQRQDGTPVVRYSYTPGQNGGVIKGLTQYYDFENGEKYSPIWADIVAPTITGVGVTNAFAQTQTATINAQDEGAVSQYYVGQSIPDLSSISNSSNTGEITSEGKWYFGVRDTEGNWRYSEKDFVKANLAGIENSNCNIQYIVAERGSSIALPGITKQGYHANSWTCGTVWNATGNTEISPVWEANTYTLTLNGNGGASSTKQVTYRAPIGSLPTLTRSGFVFNGWYDGNGNLVTADTVYEKTQDTTITAKWTGIINATAKNGSATYSGSATNGGASVTVSAPTSGYTIKYGTTAGTYNLSSIPTYTNAGEYTVYYKVTANGYAEHTGSLKITINKANAPLTLSASSGSVVYGNSLSFQATTSLSTVTASSSNTAVATVSVNGKTITATGTGVGSATITVTVQGNNNYNTTSKTYTITSQYGTISYSASGYAGQYDGSAHTGSVTVNTSGCTVRYGTTSGNYNLTSIPTYSSAGSYTVYFQITKQNYTTVTGSFNVILRKTSAMSIYAVGNNYDVRASSIGTTYSNAGYTTQCFVGSSSTTMTSSDSVSLSNVDFSRNVYTNDLGQVVFSFTVRNNNSSATSVSLATHADIKIGSNDSAPIYKTNTGFYMTDGTYTFDVFAKSYNGVTDCNLIWFGSFGSRTSYSNTATITSSNLTGTDSGMNVGWTSVSIPAYGSKTFSFIMDMR